MKAVLFDADGVIQRRPFGWRGVLQEIVGHDGDPDRFLASLFSAEDRALCGGCDFAEGLADVLRRFECQAPIARVLDAWTMIDVDRDTTRMIRGLRMAGVGCHLATNQEAHKAKYMSETLGYRELFDREFYSCDLGVAKPAPAFFSAIVASLQLEPDHVLFIDDRPENVEAARRVGIRGAVFSLDSGARGLRRLLREFGIQAA